MENTTSAPSSVWDDNYTYALKLRCTGIVSIYVHEKGQNMKITITDKIYVSENIVINNTSTISIKDSVDNDQVIDAIIRCVNKQSNTKTVKA